MFRKTPEQAIVVEADKIASMKESLDALSWERVSKIGKVMQGEVPQDEYDELARELVTIAQANTSLLGKLGVNNDALSGVFMPSGVEMLVGQSTKNYAAGYGYESDNERVPMPTGGYAAGGVQIPNQLSASPIPQPYGGVASGAAPRNPALFPQGTPHLMPNLGTDQTTFFQEQILRDDPYVPSREDIPVIPRGDGTGFVSGATNAVLRTPAVQGARTVDIEDSFPDVLLETATRAKSRFKAIFEPVITAATKGDARQAFSRKSDSTRASDDEKADFWAEKSPAHAAGSARASTSAQGMPEVTMGDVRVSVLDMNTEDGRYIQDFIIQRQQEEAIARAFGVDPSSTSLASDTRFGSSAASPFFADPEEVYAQRGYVPTNYGKHGQVGFGEVGFGQAGYGQFGQAGYGQDNAASLGAFGSTGAQESEDDLEFEQLYVSQDGTLCLYRDAAGHILSVDRAKFT
ncbi:MAG: hypothetical protein FWG24_04330 [Eggerthellaceae bacterium]|nr:hypothetical protein [Eggerthellaceae bacterium]MDR2721953.1 hypothetical protein [Coriobacteriaceae bacterium]